MVLSQRNCKCLSLDNAIEAELFPLIGRLYANDIAQFVNDVLNDSGGFGVDNPLSSAGKSVDLAFRIPSGGYRSNLFNGGDIFPPAMLERLPEIVQANQSCSVIGSTLVIGACLQILEQVWFQNLGAGEVGRND